jgi:hypothetical protein
MCSFSTIFLAFYGLICTFAAVRKDVNDDDNRREIHAALSATGTERKTECKAKPYGGSRHCGTQKLKPQISNIKPYYW